MRISVAAGLFVAVAAAHGGPASAARSLQDEVNHLVDLGYENPQPSLASLKALKGRSPQTADSLRVIEAGIGLVAADAGLSNEARQAIAELERLVPAAGAIARADALLVRADIEASEGQAQKSVASIQAAVTAYAPFCDPAVARDVKSCNAFNWYWANMFAGVFIYRHGTQGSAAIYFAAARDIAEGALRQDLEARALAFMAVLAQDDGNTELSDRLLHRAEARAVQSGETSAQEFVKSFKGMMLQTRGDLPGALTALREAQDMAAQSGHRRRTTDLIMNVVELERKLGHPDRALAEIDRALADSGNTHLGQTKGALDAERIVALLQLGRLPEAQQTLPALLDALDAKVGLIERSTYVNAIGEALLAAGLSDRAMELFDRERPAILAGSDRHFEQLVLDRKAGLQADQLARRHTEIRWWSTAGAVSVLLLGVVGGIVLWQRARNRRLALVNDALREKSERDPLTGLLNREGLLSSLKATARFDTFAGTLLLVDIDHFKKINDTLGHAGGDAVLQEIAARLQSCLREEDFVVRWGGEELVVAVLSPQFDADLLVDRIMAGITAAPAAFQQRSIHVSASIGYGSFPLDEAQRPLSFDESLAIADAGMYYAKRHGRASAVRIKQLPTDLLVDLGGLPAAVEREALTGAVSLLIKRVAGSESAQPVQHEMS
ncbi:GGDEF domain-containing protein [Roseateles sp. NT4]|uniref:GGDEF domain-containing protein n=1 Tax=Roseateles sp. NT4 TaxID=3453715 RepID=UPI003EED765D